MGPLWQARTRAGRSGQSPNSHKPLSESQWRRHGSPEGDQKAEMLKFKAFCLDYWQFLCLQPLHGVYKRYVDLRGGPLPPG